MGGGSKYYPSLTQTKCCLKKNQKKNFYKKNNLYICECLINFYKRLLIMEMRSFYANNLREVVKVVNERGIKRELLVDIIREGDGYIVLYYE